MGSGPVRRLHAIVSHLTPPPEASKEPALATTQISPSAPRDDVDRPKPERGPSALPVVRPTDALSERLAATTVGRETVRLGATSDLARAPNEPAPKTSTPLQLLTTERTSGARRPEHVDPATRSRESAETRTLALRQTIAAREALYRPGETLKAELAGAAQQLHTAMTALDAQDRGALGARLLGSEGMMPGKKPEDLMATLKRVAEDPERGRASATDRAVVIALMGDIGALYADTGATTGVENRNEDQAQRLRDHLAAQLAEQGLDPITDRSKEVQGLGGSSAVGPAKSSERSRPSKDKPPRTGVHDFGQAADERLRIPKDERLPTSRWQVAEIDRARVEDTEEPLVGHMSGSPAEILQVWDMLRGDPRAAQYVGIMQSQRASRSVRPMAMLDEAQQDQRYARAAGASALLVGLGFHSAVECLEGTLAYVGQSARSVLRDPTREDAAHLFGRGASTDLMSELFRGQTAPVVRSAL